MRFVLGILFAASAFGQTGGALQPVPIQQPLDNAGRTLQGQCLYTYAAGTTTPQTTYSNSALSVPNANPIVLNGFGREPAVYLSAVSYKIVLAYAALGSCPVSPGTVIWSQDNVYDFGELLKVTLNGSGGAAQIGFQQAGGSLITVGGAIGSVGIYDLGYSSLSSGCAAASSVPFLISKAWTAVTTQTLNCNVNFIPGGTVQPSSSQVVTFSKFPLCPGIQQCFDVSSGGAGSILFNGPVSYTRPEWFGAIPVSTSGPLNTNGAANSLAFAAAQRALPFYATNPDMVTLNNGVLKISSTGNNFGFTLNSTFHLSPYTTLEGEYQAYLLVDRSGFTGTYLLDTINANGAGHNFDDNFFTGIRNLLINTINPTATQLIGCLNWGASLNSTVKNVYCDTSTIGISVGQSDGTSIQNSTFNVYGAASETSKTGQCATISNGNAIQYNNSFRDIKCTNVGAFGSGPLFPGFLPSSGKYAFEIGANVQGLTVDTINFENWPNMFSIGVGSHDVFIKNVNANVDCLQVPNCTVRNYCDNLIDPNTFNIHMEFTSQGAKYGICIGHDWQPSTTFDTNQNFVIDQWGCIQKVTTGGTTGSTRPTWPGAGCSGTTSDGTLVWTAQGPITQACDPSVFGATATFDPSGFRINCAIPSVKRSAGSGYLTLTGPLGSSGVNDQTQYSFIYDTNTFWQTPPAFTPGVIATLTGADFNTTADQALDPHFPSGYSKLVITSVIGDNFSMDLQTATGGLYQSASKANCTIVPAGQKWGTQASMTNTFYVSANVDGGSCANAGTSMAGNQYGKVPIEVSNQVIYFSLTTPEGTAATGNITVYGYPVP